MKTRIPNLFSKCSGERDYDLYLAQLMFTGNQKRIIQVCRRIRTYAAQGPGIEAGLFTYTSTNSTRSANSGNTLSPGGSCCEKIESVVVPVLTTGPILGAAKTLTKCNSIMAHSYT